MAIKVLPETLASDADRLRRFEQEAQAAGPLNHPNIMAIYDIGTHEGVPYVVSELLEGETLCAVLLTPGSETAVPSLGGPAALVRARGRRRIAERTGGQDLPSKKEGT